MLLGAIQSCFLLTLRSIARISKLEFIALDLDASGTVDRQDGVTRFTEIVLRMLEKSEKNCLVSASLSTPIRLETVITTPAHS